MLIRKRQYCNSQASIIEVGNQHGNGDKFPIEFIEDTCRHDWESSSQQVALGTDWM
jgi:hypothetical protein